MKSFQLAPTIGEIQQAFRIGRGISRFDPAKSIESYPIAVSPLSVPNKQQIISLHVLATEADLHSFFGLDISAHGSYGAYSGSARYSLQEDLKTSENYVTVVLGLEQLIGGLHFQKEPLDNSPQPQDMRLTETAVSKPIEELLRLYGDSAVTHIDIGRAYYLIFELHVSSREFSRALSYSGEGKYEANWSVEASAHVKSVLNTSLNQFMYNMYFRSTGEDAKLPPALKQQHEGSIENGSAIIASVLAIAKKFFDDPSTDGVEMAAHFTGLDTAANLDQKKATELVVKLRKTTDMLSQIEAYHATYVEKSLSRIAWLRRPDLFVNEPPIVEVKREIAEIDEYLRKLTDKKAELIAQPWLPPSLPELPVLNHEPETKNYQELISEWFDRRSGTVQFMLFKAAELLPGVKLQAFAVYQNRFSASGKQILWKEVSWSGEPPYSVPRSPSIVASGIWFSVGTDGFLYLGSDKMGSILSIA